MVQENTSIFTRIKGGINNRLRNYYPAVSNPKLNSSYYNFLSSNGWIFQSANRTLGDYKLYTHAENNVYVYRSIQVISDTLLINGFSINNPDDMKVNFERTNYLNNLFRRLDTTDFAASVAELFTESATLPTASFTAAVYLAVMDVIVLSTAATVSICA